MEPWRNAQRCGHSRFAKFASSIADVFFHSHSRFRALFISYVGHLISMRQLMSTRMVYSYQVTDENQEHKL